MTLTNIFVPLPPLMETELETDLALLSQIQSNWCLADGAGYDALLPVNIRPCPDALAWGTDIIEALSELSDLTVNQPERAWSLINTYFQARIREASYTGKYDAIYASMEVEDIDKAIASARRMSKGQELQTQPVSRSESIEYNNPRIDSMQVEVDESSSDDEDGVTGKRKYSIRDELVAPSSKKQKPNDDVSCVALPHHSTPTITSLLRPSSPSPSPSPSPTPTPQHQPTRHRPILPMPSLTLSIPAPSTQLPSLLPLPDESSHRRYNMLMDAADRALREAEARRTDFESMEKKVQIVKRQWKQLMGKAERLRGEAEGMEGWGVGMSGGIRGGEY
ncbi:hypothetical protein CC86DRAFT_419520 [Ophiobolus disseminans]|uniref:Uncharacterized protein n=1 Tax=Ophiobolus disseminans TaxID=1469910 RepID=A0A6A6ZY95_9PLEO|nr:hypothetical protein CC86DRAFT_419520 [Ophiobolus disseminans]